MESWEGTWVNLGHSLRKLWRFDDAIVAYERAIASSSNIHYSVYTSIGWTHHLAARLDRAVHYYHKVGPPHPSPSLPYILPN
jgi:anaphase-promoting complex subunit 6